MHGKLKEPRVITHHRREQVRILPEGFCFKDNRREMIWQCFEEEGEALSHDELRDLLPYKPALQTGKPG